MANKFKKELKEQIEAINEELKKAERAKKKIVIKCPHQNSNGKLKVYSVGGDKFRCKYCGEVFSMKKISMGDLKESVEILHNVIQQMRAFSDPDTDMKFIEHLGEMDFNIAEIPEVYERISSLLQKKKKDKTNDEDEFGFRGMRGISFIDGKR